MKILCSAIIILFVQFLTSPMAMASSPFAPYDQQTDYQTFVEKRIQASSIELSYKKGNNKTFYAFRSDMGRTLPGLFNAINVAAMNGNGLEWKNKSKPGNPLFEASIQLDLCVNQSANKSAAGVEPFATYTLEEPFKESSTARCDYTFGATVLPNRTLIPVELNVTLKTRSTIEPIKLLDVIPVARIVPWPSFQHATDWQTKRLFMPIRINNNVTGNNKYYEASNNQVTFKEYYRNVDCRSNKIEYSFNNGSLEYEKKVRARCPEASGFYEYSNPVKVRHRPLNGTADQLTERQDDDVRLHVFNVGDGNCSILQGPGQQYDLTLLDCGALGRSQPTEFMRDYLELVENARTIDMVVSHPDKDHYIYLSEFFQRSADTGDHTEKAQIGRQIKMKLRNSFLGGNFDFYADNFANEVATQYAIEQLTSYKRRLHSKIIEGPKKPVVSTARANGGRFYGTMIKNIGGTQTFMKGYTTKPVGSNSYLPRTGVPGLPSGAEAKEITRFYVRLNPIVPGKVGGDGAVFKFPFTFSMGAADITIGAANTPMRGWLGWNRARTQDTDALTKNGFEPGTQSYLDGVIELLSNENGEPKNTSSIVLDIVYGGKKILMTADASQRAVQSHLQAVGHYASANNFYEMVSLMHHGSNQPYHSSASVDFRSSLLVKRFVAQSSSHSSNDFPTKASFTKFKKTNKTDNSIPVTVRQFLAGSTAHNTDVAFNPDGTNSVSNAIHTETNVTSTRWDKKSGNTNYISQPVYTSGDHGKIVLTLPSTEAAEAACYGPFDEGSRGGATSEDLLKQNLVSSEWCRTNR